MPSLARYIQLMFVAVGVTLLFAGAALAAQADRRLPIATHPRSSILPVSLPRLLASSSLRPFVFSSPRLLASSPPSDGAELYQFWCSTCHGDRGQGLTQEWRATWPEGKQNCWQSKCHATNHPPEGFVLPKNVPALIGPETLTKFRTAQDLYVYSRATMPYWSPNLLKDEEYRAITAFLVKANYAERDVPPPTSLSGDWTAVSLHPGTVVAASLADKTSVTSQPSSVLPQPENFIEPQPPGQIVSSTQSLWLWAAVGAAGAALIIWFTRRFFFFNNKKG